MHVDHRQFTIHRLNSEQFRRLVIIADHSDILTDAWSYQHSFSLQIDWLINLSEKYK